MTNQMINGTFDEIMRFMKSKGSATTEHDKGYLYLVMDTYKIKYEIDDLRLIKISKHPFKREEQKIEEIAITHPDGKLRKLLCSDISLLAIHMEIKHRFEQLKLR